MPSRPYAVPVGWPRFIGRTGVEALRAAADRGAWLGCTPRGPDDITLDWLRATITGGRGIDGFEIVSHHHGTAQHVLLALRGNAAPPSAFVKLTPVRPVERIFHTTMGLGDAEERVYRELRPLWPAVMPAYLGSSRDERLGRVALVIEDLSGAVRFADVVNGCSVSDAHTVAAALAAVHRPLWGSGRFGADLNWLAAPRRSTLRYGRRLAYAALRRLPAPMRYPIGDGQRIAAALGGCAMTLIHGDSHCGNMGFERERRAGAVGNLPLAGDD